MTFFSALSVIHNISSERKQRITRSKIKDLIYEFAIKRGRVVCASVPEFQRLRVTFGIFLPEKFQFG